MRKKLIKILKDITLIFIIVFFIIKPFFIDSIKIKNNNMINQLVMGDFVLVNKFIYGARSAQNIPFTNIPLPNFSLPALDEPERGDLVVFKYPGDRDMLEAKTEDFQILRVIGLPGDKIEIIDRLVFVNGKKLKIPSNIKYSSIDYYEKNIIDKNIFPRGMKWNIDNYGPLTIPAKGSIFEINANNIEQWKVIINREFNKQVVSVLNNEVFINGKKSSTYKVLNDYYFLMGDNRDECNDSRYFGFVKKDDIIGKPFMIFWSWNSKIPFSNIFDLIKSIRFRRIIKFID